MQAPGDADQDHRPDSVMDASLVTTNADASGFSSTRPSHHYRGVSENNAAQQSMTGQDPAASSEQEPLRQQLETWSCAILRDQGNVKDFTSTTEHMAPLFRARIDVLPVAMSREQHINALKEHLRRMPNFGIEIINISTDLYELRGVADVFLYSYMTGLEYEFEREAIAVLRWQKHAGVWTCMKYTTLRGPAGFATM